MGRDPIEERLDLGPVRRRKTKAKLKSAPNRAIEKLCMVRRRDDDDIAWELVELHQQKGDDALDLTRLVRVATLLPDRIEFVKNNTLGRVRT